MKKIIAALILCIVLTSSTFAQEVNKLQKCNNVIRAVYNDITKIKDSHSELRNFNEKVLKQDFGQRLMIDYGIPIKRFPTPEGTIWIHIYFLDNLNTSVEEEFIKKVIYIEEIPVYLCYKVQIHNSQLEKDIIEMIIKNAKVKE